MSRWQPPVANSLATGRWGRKACAVLHPVANPWLVPWGRMVVVRIQPVANPWLSKSLWGRRPVANTLPLRQRGRTAHIPALMIPPALVIHLSGPALMNSARLMYQGADGQFAARTRRGVNFLSTTSCEHSQVRLVQALCMHTTQLCVFVNVLPSSNIRQC